MKKIFIYFLKDPITNEVRYVGKTSQALCKRFNNHIYNAKYNKHNLHLSNWICKLLKNNLKPILGILEVCNEMNWQEREQFWILEFENLLNCTEGGDGCLGFKHSQESINKLKNIKHPPHSPEFKELVSERFKALPRTSQWKINISNGLKGHKASEEAIKHLSEAHKGYIMPEAQKQKIRDSLKGKSRPIEVVQKIKNSKKHSVIIVNIITNQTIEFDSCIEAAEYCSCHIETLYKKIKNKQLINKKFTAIYKKDIVET